MLYLLPHMHVTALAISLLLYIPLILSSLFLSPVKWPFKSIKHALKIQIFLSAMRNWMNSLGATPRVKYIYEDLKDGLAILQVCDFETK